MGMGPIMNHVVTRKRGIPKKGFQPGVAVGVKVVGINMGKRKPKTYEIAAIEDLLKRIRIAESKGDYQELASLHNQLGNQYRLLGDHGSAIEHHQEEINISKAHNRKDRMGLGIAYRNMGEVYTELKQEAEAIKYIQMYLKIAKELGNLVEEQRACITLGRAYLSVADKDPVVGEGDDDNSNAENRSKTEEAIATAEKWFRTAYTLLNEDELKSQLNGEKELLLMKCNNCQNLGLTLEMRGKLLDASTWIGKAVDIGSKYQFHDNLAPCYSVLCGIYLRLGRPKDALAAARNAVKTAKSLGNIALETEANLLEAKSLFAMDEVDTGKRLLKKLRQRIRKKDALHDHFEELDLLLTAAVRICRTQDNLYVSKKDETEKRMKLHEILGDNYTTLSNFAVAIAHYKKACEYAETTGIQGKKLSRLYFSIAESYKDLENYKDAHKYYLKELAMNRGNLAEEFKTQTNITFVLEKMSMSFEEIMDAHEQAIKMAQMADNLSKEVTARNNFAMYLKGVGRRSESEKQTQIVNKIKEKNNVGDCDEPDSQDLLDEEEEFIDLDDLSEEDDSDDEADDGRRSNRKRANTRVNEAGETQLHIAAKRGDLKGVRRLIRQGLTVKTKDNAGWTALHEACNFGHAAVVDELLKNGADVNDAGGALAEKITPLHDAASNGHCEVMKILLKHEAKVLARDVNGRYPIDSLICWRESESASNLPDHELTTYREVKELLKKRMEKAGKPYRKEDEQRARKKALRPGSPKSDTSLFVGRARDYDCPIPVKIAMDDYDPDQEGDGQKIYQNAMKLVRRNDTETKRSKNKRAMSPGPRGALIPAELDVHEDWLLPDAEDPFPTTSTSARSKPKRKRDPMDDVVQEEYGNTRRKSGSHKQRRRSRASLGDDEDFELMDIEPESNSRDRQTSQRSSSMVSSTLSPELGDMLNLNNDDADFAAMFDNEFEPLVSAHDDFLPSQRPSTSTVEFGTTVDVEVLEKDFDSESPELSSLFRTKRGGNRSPAKTSRRNALTSSDDDDNSVKDSNSKSKLKFSKIASTIKQKNLVSLNGSNQSGRNKKPPVQSRLNFTVKNIQKPSRSRLSNGSRRSSSPEEIYVSPSPSVNNSNARKNAEVWRLKVWIQGKPLLVPVEEDKLNETIDWLASECAKRYLDTHGVKPILTLQTKDKDGAGAILAGTDLIRLVVDAENKELEGVVTSFDLPPLVDRYSSTCVAAAVEPDMEVKSNLNLCQSSNVLNLIDINLRGKAAEVLMTALQRQNSLNTLILSGCCLFDSGLLELCRVLPTLSGLTYLDLSSNGITKSGFIKLVEVFLDINPQADVLSVGCRVPLRIATLILSHNPLGNFVGTSLAALLDRLKELKRLDIADCDFTEKLFNRSRSDLTKAFSGSHLEELDISYNNLKGVGIEQCLQHLPARRIRALNCSSCDTNVGVGNAGGGTIDRVAKAICSFLSKNEDCCNLTTLKLRDCGLNDKSMEQILDTFDRLVRLENLELTCNEDLTALSITNMLGRSVDRNIPLTRLDMGGIPHLWSSAASPSDEMILNALELKMSSNKKLVFLKLPAEVFHHRPQDLSQNELSKLESRIVALMEEYAGNASFNYKKFGSCIVYELDD